MARLARTADKGGVRIPCAVCRNPFVKLRLHRVGHRMLCGSCFAAERRRRSNGPSGPALTGPDFASLRRLNRGLTIAGVVGKSLVFLALFLWARRSATGDAALHGVLFADVFTFILFSVLDWHFRQLPITVGAIVQLVLVILFANRHALFEVPPGTVSFAVALGFFMLTLLLKSTVWWAEHILEATGLKERESP